MTIYIYFKEINVGELTFKNNAYFYTTNKKNIQKAFDNGYPIDLFMCNNDFISENLPYSFLSQIPDIDQEFLIEELNITPQDTDFEKLCKIAKSTAVKDDFHFETK